MHDLLVVLLQHHRVSIAEYPSEGEAIGIGRAGRCADHMKTPQQLLL